MKLFLLIPLILALASCSFSSDEESSHGQETNNELQGEARDETRPLDPNTLDDDGDMISNADEVESGTNPKIADIPKVDLYISEALSLHVEGSTPLGEKNYSFYYEIAKDDPNYLGLLGFPTLKKDLLTKASQSASIQNLSHALLDFPDLYSFSFKNLPTSFIQKEELVFDRLNFETIHQVWLELKVGVLHKLDSTESEIKNPKMAFYINDPLTDKEVILKELTIFEDFQMGSFKTEKVFLPISVDYLKETLFKYGKLPKLKLIDFEIPSRKSTLKNLINKVLNHTTALIKLKPNGFDYFYIANSKESTLISLLTKAFGEDFTIDEGKLSKLGELENNISFNSDEGQMNLGRGFRDFISGSWFTFVGANSSSNTMQNPYKRTYKRGELIALSYFTSHELSRVSKRPFVTKVKNKASSFKDKVSLGDLSVNSNLNLVIEGLRDVGDVAYVQTKDFNSGGSCGENCRVRNASCTTDLTSIESIDRTFYYRDSLLNQINLEFKGQIISLSDLILSKGITFDQKSGFISFSIDRLYSQIKKILELRDLNLSEIPIDSNRLNLIFKDEKGQAYEGLRLTRAEGSDPMECILLAVNLAGNKGFKLNEHSFQFNEWQGIVNWSKLTRGSLKETSLKTTFNLRSNLIQFFN